METLLLLAIGLQAFVPSILMSMMIKSCLRRGALRRWRLAPLISSVWLITVIVQIVIVAIFTAYAPTFFGIVDLLKFKALVVGCSVIGVIFPVVIIVARFRE